MRTNGGQRVEERDIENEKGAHNVRGGMGEAERDVLVSGIKKEDGSPGNSP